MIKNDILITVVDGQGGGIGRQYIESLRKQLPKDLPGHYPGFGHQRGSHLHMMQAGATTGPPGKMPLSQMSVRPILSSVWSPSSYRTPFSVNYPRKWPTLSVRAMLCGFSFHSTAATPGSPCFPPDLYSSLSTKPSK